MDRTVGPKVLEDPLALLTDRSVDRLPRVAAFPAQTVMQAAVHSGAVVAGVAPGASPVAASLADIRLEASLADMVGVVAVDNYWAGIGLLRKSKQTEWKGDPCCSSFFYF